MRLRPAVFLALLIAFTPLAARADEPESAYDRVIRTNTLRCGYGIYPPFVTKDVNTGKMGGYVVELMQQFERQTGVKVEWTEEVDWGQLAVALSTHKVDAICSTIWASPQRAKAIGFSRPLFFSTVFPVVRTDDHRFDTDILILNSPAYRIAVNDSDISEEIAKVDFPNAQQVAKPQTAGGEQLYLDIVAKKADITFDDQGSFNTFAQANPGKVRMIQLQHPLRAYANVIGVDMGETKLLNLINATILTLQLNGSLSTTLRPFLAENPGVIRLPAQPYLQ